MRAYGNLINRVMEKPTTRKPEEGEGCTLTAFSDRHAGTIVKVESKGRWMIVTIREDKATRTDNNGMSESQEYTYERNPEGAAHYFRAPINSKGDIVGEWRESYRHPKTGRLNFSNGGLGLVIGHRDAYHDYSF